MLQDKRSWKILKKGLKVTKGLQLVILLCVTVVFPLLIAVLANTWTNKGTQSSLAGWFLLFVGFLQLILAAHEFLSKAVCPEAALAESLENEEKLEIKTHELLRREEAYRLIRASFNQLTSQTCKISAAQPETWCSSGFEEGLKPIMEPLLRNVHTVLGVKSSVYTMEVYLSSGIRTELNYVAPTEDGLKLSFFLGASIQREAVVELLRLKVSPALSAYQTNTTYCQHVSSNHHLFYDGDKPKSAAYFRTFAVTPLYPACSTTAPPIGALMLTSIQDEPLSPDVQDTMAFFGSIISTYLYSYQQCLFQHIDALGTQATIQEQAETLPAAGQALPTPTADAGRN